MSTRPIIMGRDSIRAILAGDKTQTRRRITQPNAKMERGAHQRSVWDTIDWERATYLSDRHHTKQYGLVVQTAENLCSFVTCRIQPGDDLWVRETWCHGLYGGYHYRADCDDGEYGPTWRPAILMPRVASRLTLHVTEVRVELLWDITDADALAEGVYRHTDLSENGHARCWDWQRPQPADTNPRDRCLGRPRYAYLNWWAKLAKMAPHRLCRDNYETNPHVWVITFEVES